MCVLDGDSEQGEDLDGGVIKLPGKTPESEVFDYVHDNIDTLSMQLAVALHLAPEAEQRVKKAIEDVALTNRDPHLLFNQVGQRVSFTPANIVSSAFIGLWLHGNPNNVKKLADFISKNLHDFEAQRSSE